MTKLGSISGISIALARVILHNRKKREKEKLTNKIPINNDDDKRTLERVAIIPSRATVDPIPDMAARPTKKRKRKRSQKKKEQESNRVSLGNESSTSVLDQLDQDKLAQPWHRAAAITDRTSRKCPDLQDQKYQPALQHQQLEMDMVQRDSKIQLMERELREANVLLAQMVKLEAKRHQRYLEQRSQISSLEQRVHPLEQKKQALMARLEVVEQKNAALMQQKQVFHCAFQAFVKPPALLLEAQPVEPCILENGSSQAIHQGELKSLSGFSPLLNIGHGPTASVMLGNCREEDTQSNETASTAPLVHATIQHSIGKNLEAEQERMIFLQELPSTRAMVHVLTENGVSSQPTLPSSGGSGSSSSTSCEIKEEGHSKHQFTTSKPDLPTTLGKGEGKIWNKETRPNAASIPQPNLDEPTVKENLHVSNLLQDYTASEFTATSNLKYYPQAPTAANPDKTPTKTDALYGKSTSTGTTRDNEGPPSSEVEDGMPLKLEWAPKVTEASAGAKLNEAVLNSFISTKGVDESRIEILLSSNIEPNESANKNVKDDASVFSNKTEVVLLATKELVSLEGSKKANSSNDFKESKTKATSLELVTVEKGEKVANDVDNSKGPQMVEDNKVVAMDYEKQEQPKLLISTSDASPQFKADEAALPREIEIAGAPLYSSSLRKVLMQSHPSGETSPCNDDPWDRDAGKKASKASCQRMPPEDWTKAKKGKSVPDKWMMTRKPRQEKKQSSLDHFVKRTPKENFSICDNSNWSHLPPKLAELSRAKKTAQSGSKVRTVSQRGKGLCDGSKSKTEDLELDSPAPVQRIVWKSKQHLGCSSLKARSPRQEPEETEIAPPLIMAVKCQRTIVKGSKQDKRSSDSASSAKNVHLEDTTKHPLANKLTSSATKKLKVESMGLSSKCCQNLPNLRASDVAKHCDLVSSSDKLDSKESTLKAEDTDQTEKQCATKELETCKHPRHSIQHNTQTSHLTCTQVSQLEVTATNNSSAMSEPSKKEDTKTIRTRLLIVSTARDELESQESETHGSPPVNATAPGFSNSWQKQPLTAAAVTQGSENQWCPSDCIHKPSSSTLKKAPQESKESMGSPLNAAKHWQNADTQESEMQWNPSQPSGKPSPRLPDTQATETTQCDTRTLAKPSKRNDFNEFYAKATKCKDSPATTSKKRKLPKVLGRGWLSNRQSRLFDQEFDAAAGVKSAPKHTQRRTRARSHHNIPVRSKSSEDKANGNMTEAPERGHKMSAPEFAHIQGRGGKRARHCGDCDKRDCVQCRNFYKALRTQGIDLAKKSKSVSTSGLEHSRHTKWSTAAKPDTPPQFWEMSFADSQRKQQEVEALADAEFLCSMPESEDDDSSLYPDVDHSQTQMQENEIGSQLESNPTAVQQPWSGQCEMTPPSQKMNQFFGLVSMK